MRLLLVGIPAMLMGVLGSLSDEYQVLGPADMQIEVGSCPGTGVVAATSCNAAAVASVCAPSPFWCCKLAATGGKSPCSPVPVYVGTGGTGNSIIPNACQGRLGTACICDVGTCKPGPIGNIGACPGSLSSAIPAC